MTHETKTAPAASTLPKLPAKARPSNPFKAHMEAVVATPPSPGTDEQFAPALEQIERQIERPLEQSPTPSIRQSAARQKSRLAGPSPETMTAKAQVKLPPEMLVELKIYCARNGLTLQQVMYDALKDVLSRTKS